jgi:hypothetical protein
MKLGSERVVKEEGVKPTGFGEEDFLKMDVDVFSL